MTYAIDSQPLWTPNPATAGATRMAQLIRATGHNSYGELWQWSVDQPEAFWSQVWDFCGAVGEKGLQVVQGQLVTAKSCVDGEMPPKGDTMRLYFVGKVVFSSDLGAICG